MIRPSERVKSATSRRGLNVYEYSSEAAEANLSTSSVRRWSGAERPPSQEAA
jgi:hypothetical protein